MSNAPLTYRAGDATDACSYSFSGKHLKQVTPHLLFKMPDL